MVMTDLLIFGSVVILLRCFIHRGTFEYVFVSMASLSGWSWWWSSLEWQSSLSLSLVVYPVVRRCDCVHGWQCKNRSYSRRSLTDVFFSSYMDLLFGTYDYCDFQKPTCNWFFFFQILLCSLFILSSISDMISGNVEQIVAMVVTDTMHKRRWLCQFWLYNFFDMVFFILALVVV